MAITREDAKKVAELLGTTRDELAKTLRVGNEGPIKEADEWRPLADMVLGLCAMAVQKSKEEEERLETEERAQILDTLAALSQNNASKLTD